MDKGSRYGNYKTINPNNISKQIEIMKEQLDQIGSTFEKEEFTGLNLTDFKVEFILTSGSIGWKITKK